MTDDPKQKIKLVLTKILNEHYLGAESTSFLELRIERILTDTNIERDVFVRIIENLKEKGILTKYSFWRMNKDGNEMKVSYDRDPKWNLCNISIPRNFRELAEEYIYELSNKNTPLNNHPVAMLYFEKNGDFWHGDKSKFNYPIKTKRLEIMKYLIENRDGENYLPTKTIASAVDKNEHQVMTEIDKIRDRIKTFLDLEDVIESKPGYRINPKYTIITKYD